MRDDRMVIRADARAMSAVTATSVRVSERWKGSRHSASPCVSYTRYTVNDDGSRTIHDGKVFRAAQSERVTTPKAVKPLTPHRTMAYDLPALLVD